MRHDTIRFTEGDQLVHQLTDLGNGSKGVDIMDCLNKLSAPFFVSASQQACQAESSTSVSSDVW